MDVRLARPTDAPLVLALALDDTSHLVNGHDWSGRPVLRTIARTAFPLAFTGRTWIARENGHVAMLEAQPRQYVIGWDVVRLAVRGDHSAVLPAVVQAVTDHLQSRGVPRLFARCSEEAGADLKPVGFHALARELVLRGRVTDAESEQSLPVESRYRMPQDAWPLHQLESAVTPAMIRQIEGLTSLDWSRELPSMSQIVVERDGHLVAWTGWGARSGGDVHQIGLLVHPDHKALAGDLLHHVLGQLPGGSECVARIREYQVEALDALLEAGFTVVAEDVLMVKHAGVEPARVAKRIRVARVPSIQAFRIQLGAIGHAHLASVTPSLSKEELS